MALSSDRFQVLSIPAFQSSRRRMNRLGSTRSGKSASPIALRSIIAMIRYRGSLVEFPFLGHTSFLYVFSALSLPLSRENLSGLSPRGYAVDFPRVSITAKRSYGRRVLGNEARALPDTAERGVARLFFKRADNRPFFSLSSTPCTSSSPPRRCRRPDCINSDTTVRDR